jgi:hypothetical protein
VNVHREWYAALAVWILLSAVSPAFGQEKKRDTFSEEPRTEHPSLLRSIRWTAVAAASSDVGYATFWKSWNNFVETDPIAKPVAYLPIPAFVSCSATFVAIGYLASVKMEHNRHSVIRRAAWIIPTLRTLRTALLSRTLSWPTQECQQLVCRKPAERLRVKGAK